MRIGLFLLAGCVAISAPAHAGPSADANAEEFYQRAVALEGKGMMAMFDKRSKQTIAEMKDAGASAQSANDAAKRKGSQLYCVPDAARKRGLNVEKVLSMLRALGEPQRRKLNLQQAWIQALQKEYPCR